MAAVSSCRCNAEAYKYVKWCCTLPLSTRTLRFSESCSFRFSSNPARILAHTIALPFGDGHDATDPALSNRL
jgi:hypothetical protein